MEKTYRYEADFIPDGVTWITDKPIAIAPELTELILKTMEALLMIQA